MSQTYELACTDCRIALWIAQGYVDEGDPRDVIQEKGKLYSTAEHLKDLRDFLFLHMGHHLLFQNSDKLWLEDYAEFRPIDED